MCAGNRREAILLLLIAMLGLGTLTPLPADTVPQGLSPLKAIELIFNNQTAGLVDSVNALKAQLASQGIELNAYNLDASEPLRAALSANLPANPEQAKKIVLERLNQINPNALRERFQAAYQAHSKSVQYGLARFPAWVFNHGEAVIYGDLDLNSALQRFQHSVAEQSIIKGHVP